MNYAMPVLGLREIVPKLMQAGFAISVFNTVVQPTKMVLLRRGRAIKPVVLSGMQ